MPRRAPYGRSRERVRTPGQVTLLGSGEYTSQRHDGISLLHLNAVRSQSGEDRRANSWQGQPCHSGIPGHLDGVHTDCGC